MNNLITERAICKSRNGESGNGMKEMMEMRRIRVRMIGNVGDQVRMMGMQGIRVGMQCIRLRMWGIRMEIMGTRVEMRGMQEIRVGMRRTGSGNERNTGENLRIQVELKNYNCGEGQETVRFSL